ncbi:hypothetical protein [Pseudooctadecabacter jejudonensis]|uniref:DUF2169 domain-containing protein n=1 Tax=Pseudooctadecabacter jejudonensis TaxID=1391910 RepID=A0A1Y5SHL4_9RHOB|nr:hypothetical protein [Pseudooctadecabacter jejudonensis]SLN41031.1 hypothetical protein PSJ8397_02049 [Pseudooctadecabacter jejudonensis]
MRSANTGPMLHPDDQVRFFDHHRPSLMAGSYSIEVAHDVGSLGINAARTQEISIAGPRFALAPNEIATSFPARGTEGQFETVLPHVLLSRPSLPWERSACLQTQFEPGDPKATAPAADLPPWLALMVFDAEEIEGCAKTVPAADLIHPVAGHAGTAPSSGAQFAQLNHDVADDPKTPVAVIDLPRDLALGLLPKPQDLNFLTVVRDVEKTAQGAPHEARSVVIANRLPLPGKRNVVHLVSLEHQYTPKPNADLTKPWWTTHTHWTDQIKPGPTLRFVSLFNWDFTCDAAPADLQHILEGLDHGTLSIASSTLNTTLPLAQTGAVPVALHKATGARTAAWYRGPFQVFSRSAAVTLPARQADALTRQDPATNMTDQSYASAWELGRLLALRDPAIGLRLHQWKRQCAHAARAAAQQLTQTPPPPAPDLPDDIHQWFDAALLRLGAVPYSYLLPDPDVLPPETIAPFRLDRVWLAALVDGAFSIGRVTEQQADADATLRAALPAVDAASGAITRQTTGVLVRSRAVRDWPDLVIDGFAASGATTPLRPLRYDTIGPETRLLLFEGPLARVDVHLHPMAIHFGLDGTHGALSKAGQPVSPRKGTNGVLEIADLAQALGTASSRAFAFEMIETVPRISRTFDLPHE